MRRKHAAHKPRMRVERQHVRIFVVLAGLALTAAEPALADDMSESHPVDSVLKMLNLKTDQGRVPDFVETSRPKTAPDFVPVGTQHPSRPVKVKSAAEIKAMEAELDSARIRQDQISGRKQPTDPAVPQPAPKPRKVKTAPATAN